MESSERRTAGVRRSIAAAMWITVGAHAQASLSHHNGTYVYAEGRKDEARIERAIDDATADMGFVQRNIARRRLEDSNRPFERFQVYFEGETVLLRSGGHDYELDVGAPPIEAEGLTGNPAKVRANIVGHDLHQTFRAEKGTRILEFVFHEDGLVTLKTRIESKHLPAPVAYSLDYRRAS